MAAISATSYATPSSQAWQSRARLDQMRREADQAEAHAQQLRSQADQAEQVAQTSQDKVRDASAAVAQSDSTYSTQLRKQLAATDSRQTQALLTTATANNNKIDTLQNTAPKTGSTFWASANQRTSSGRLVNLSV